MISWREILINDMKRIRLNCSKGYDKNYVARLITLTENDFEPHPRADRLKLAKVFGFRVIIGIDAKPGDYIYFPVGSQISESFLTYSSNFYESRRNRDQSVRGTFENSGRVKAIKLRGEFSEGWICEVSIFEEWLKWMSGFSEEVEIDYGVSFFDIALLGENRTSWICKKYIVKGETETKKTRMRGKVPGHLERRVPKDQFRFHYETEQLKYCPDVIKPESYIWITKKVDGTSGISSYTQIKRLWYEFWKPKRYYQRLYASSSIIKSEVVNHRVGPGFYGVDIWKEADKVVSPRLDHGMTAYYEIVGYLQNGGFIQKEDDFGCVKPEPGGKFRIGQHFRVLVYRLTVTTQEGTVIEFNPRQVKGWCDKVGLESVKILYEGLAKDLYPNLNPAFHWSENFLTCLSKDGELGMERLESECKNQVPQEGIVIRVGEKAYKLKTEAHLLWKQEWIEKGVVDMEDLENRHE